MITRYKIVEDGQIYFLTSTIIEWLPVFTRKVYFDIILDSFNYSRRYKGLKIYAYVIMDNHFHLIAQGDNLGKTIKELKSHTAREIIKLAEQDKKEWLLNQLSFYRRKHKIGSVHQVWQEGSHPKQIVSEEMLRQKMEYLHHNPVRAGLAERPEEWLYSSARHYMGLPGILEIDVLEL
ncbi:MAG: transposase [Deltaproteobacteria bacterium]|nr:transposase [Deltaproteobacteria bacterium]